MRRFALAIALLGSLAGPAAAHQSSVKQVDVAVDGARAAVALTIAPGDVTQPLGLRDTARPAPAEAAVPVAAAFVARWIAIATTDGVACPAGPARARVAGTFVVVEWEVTCAASIAGLALDFTSFFVADRRHEAVVIAHVRGEPGEPVVVRAAAPVLAVRVGGDGAWVLEGVRRGALPHACFVLALLLAAVLELRTFAGAGRASAAMVGAFGVAELAALVAAALGVLELPVAVVEVATVVAIASLAIERAIRPATRSLALPIVGGLVCGLELANLFAALLPPPGSGPALGFALGAALRLVVTVAIALAALWLTARALGAPRYRRLLPIGALAITLAAVGWVIERWTM